MGKVRKKQARLVMFSMVTNLEISTFRKHTAERNGHRRFNNAFEHASQFASPAFPLCVCLLWQHVCRKRVCMGDLQ